MKRLSPPAFVLGLLSFCLPTGCSTQPPPASPTVTVTSVAPTISTARPETVDEMFARVRSGVVRIQSVTCEGSAAGTGFFIDADLVLTVAHVVEGATSITVRGDKGVVRGTVVGMDVKRELALIRTEPAKDGKLEGYAFKLASTPPRVGQDVVALGYPEGQQLAMFKGSVTSLDRQIEIGDQAIAGLFQHEANATQGNSGGPLLDSTGAVLGLHEAAGVQWVRGADGRKTPIEKPGMKYAVPAASAGPLAAAWKANPVPVSAPSCPRDYRGLLSVKSEHAEAPILADSIFAYFYLINDGDYENAWSLLTPQAKATFGSVQGFAERFDKSTFSAVLFEKANRESISTDSVTLSFVETRPGPQAGGDGCLSYSQEWTMSLASGYWRIDSTKDLHAPSTCTRPSASTSR